MPLSIHELPLTELVNLSRRASEAVLRIYRDGDFAVDHKSDDSPVTLADTVSHRILSQGLAQLTPDIPIVSEEGDPAAHTHTITGEQVWIVDPLDGTKNFINRDDEFVVCFALSQRGQATFGLAAAPALDTVYYGGASLGSFKQVGDEPATHIHVASVPTQVVAVSRLHGEQATDRYITTHYPQHERRVLGSLLKFIAVAEGTVDAYPRLDHTMKLWDVAAGHAIVEGAGGSVTRPDGSAIDYRATHQHNPLHVGDFVAHS